MIPTMAFDSICRLCMKRDANFHSIFAEPNNLCSKIMEISPKLQVFFGDGLPAQVCEKCLQQVDICYNFRLQCEESDTVFKHYLSSDLHNQDLPHKSDATDFGEESVVFKEESVMCVLEELKKEPDTNGPQYREEYADKNTKENDQDPNHVVNTSESRSLERALFGLTNNVNYFVPQELDKSNETEFRDQSVVGNEIGIEDSKEIVYEVEELEDTQENEHKCRTCTNVFTSKESWEQHKCSTPYRCVICMMVLPGEGDLRAHMVKHEMEPCRICGKTFTVKKNYLSHMRVHAGIGPSCKYCNKVFPSLHALKIHCRKHTGERPYVCEFCGETFRHNQGRTIHLMRHTGERPYQCRICLVTFTAKATMEYHIRTHTGEKPFVCEICGTKFRDSSGLRHHIKAVHVEKDFRFKCSWCHKEYTSNSQLKSHVRMHTGERPYECDFCGKAFTKGNLLTRHIWTHTGEKSYNCTVCEKTFSSSSSRNRHIRTHTGETPFACATCEKAFALRRDLVKHVFKFQH